MLTTNIKSKNTHFQQDGAPPHSTEDILDLSEIATTSMPSQEVSQFALVMHFLLPLILTYYRWTLFMRLCSKVIGELNTVISSVMKSILTEEHKQVFINLEQRLHFVVSSDGQHFKNLLPFNFFYYV